MRRAIVLTLALALPACDQDRFDDGIRDDPAVEGLQSCTAVETQIEQLAIRDMNAAIDEIIASLDDRGGLQPIPLAAPAPAPRGSATDFTTTNTQEKGVDEPDFVKNDGSRIFVLNGRQLVILSAWPPESARIESTTVLEGQPAEMLLDGNTLVVFSRTSLKGEVPGIGSPDRVPFGFVPQPFNDSVKVTVFDVGGAAPRVVHTQYLEGQYVSARRRGHSVRFVSTAPPRGPELRYWPDGEVDWSSREAARAALERLRVQNIQKIKAAALADWLPRIFEPGPNDVLHDVKRECSSFYAANVPTRLGFTTVSTLDLGIPATDHVTLLTEASEVYASRDALYLAARHYWFSRPSETQVREDHTYLFKFDIASSPQRVRYLAAGGVPGFIADQFSLGEEGGDLRVATTRQTFLGWQLRASTNNVFVLRPSNGRLTRVGELTGLARDERIYSARFDGTRGFVVTFRQVDPLFTLDLSNPREPRVAGELKVPGFSTYLHPIDSEHLLAIGRDVSEDGRLRNGIQLQVFEVRDFANPRLQHKLVLGTPSSSSEAEYDHKAFTYFASRGLLAIPFSDWSSSRGDRFVSALQVLRVSLETGIVPLGAIEHSDLVQGTSGRGYPGWTPQVRRSVMMDDFVYSISSGGTKVHDTRDLSRPVATVVFPD